jgi:segregation and condensation protein B
MIRRLNDLYDSSGRAFRVERVAGGYQLLTRAQFAGWVRRLEHVPRETRLSAPALETLAVIAYRQPVLRAEIDAIRGVNCGEILRQLMERDLVRIAGRSEDLGRPYLYATTRQFLRMFGLESLESLPRVQAMQSGSNEDTPMCFEKGRFRPRPTGEEKGTQKEEESGMSRAMLSGLDRENSQQPLVEDEFVVPPVEAYDDDDDDYDAFYDDGDEDEEAEVTPIKTPEIEKDVELEDEDVEDEDFEELDDEDEDEDEEELVEEEEDEWEEVDDDDDWDDEDDDWDDELDDDEEEEEEEEDWE